MLSSSPWAVLLGIQSPPPPLPMEALPPPPPVSAIAARRRKFADQPAARSCKHCGAELTRDKATYCNDACRFPHERRDEIARLFDSGMSQADIARKLGVGESVVLTALIHTTGVRTPSAIQSKRIDAEIAALYSQGMNVKAISEQVFLSTSSVYLRMKNLGIGIRQIPRSESMDKHRAAVLAEYRPGKKGHGSDAIAHRIGLPTKLVRALIREERMRLGLNRKKGGID